MACSSCLCGTNRLTATSKGCGSRAESVGGVALAHGDPARDELLVAWAGLDNGVPQVFLTLVGKGGTKLAQRMLTVSTRFRRARVSAVTDTIGPRGPRFVIAVVVQ